MSAPLSISVIIPVYNAASTLPRALEALAAANPAPLEIVVVDDGSTDDSAGIAERYGCRLLRHDVNRGAAVAKNNGARVAQGDVLFFTDSDIVVPNDLFARLSASLADQATEGVIGALSPDIPRSDFPSQFKNLWMVFTYNRFPPGAPVGLFYTSVAAMRRDCFIATGGFDEGYAGASIAEDTEFGQRAWAKGIRIRFDPALAVTHLKRYSIAGVLREDFRRARALMFMRLRKWRQPFFTSVPLSYQSGVPIIYATLMAVLLVPFLMPVAGATVLVMLTLFYLLNFGFIRYLGRVRGLGLAIGAVLFLPLDSFVVGLGMLQAAGRFLMGQRY